MKYCSTRNSKLNKTFDEIIIEVLASDGGLYMPKSWPKINTNEIFNNKDITYPDLATLILSNYVGDTISKSELENIANDTYKVFTNKKVAPLINF